MGVGQEKIIAVCDDEKTTGKIAAVPEMILALKNDLHVLKLWRGAREIPADVAEGIDISISKV